MLLNKADARGAEVPLRDERGRKLCFDSLRDYATWLAAGDDLKTALELIRHTDPKLTVHYHVETG